MVVVLVVADILQRGHVPWPELGWLVLIVAEICALLILPVTLWKRLEDAGATLDSLLPEDENEKLAGWLAGKLAPRGHLLWCLLGAAVGAGSSFVVNHFHWAGAHFVAGQHVAKDDFVPGHWAGAPFSVSYYVATALLGFFAFDVIRWVWRSPLVLRHVASHCRGLRINKLAPADTPAVQKMSELLSQGSLRAAVGLALFAAPFVWIVADSPTKQYRLDLALFTAAPMLVALVTAAYFSFVPERWLTGMLEAEQRRVLAPIGKQWFVDGELNQPSDELDRKIKLYQTIAAGSVETPAARATLRNTGKVLLAVTPYVVAFVAKILHLKLG